MANDSWAGLAGSVWTADPNTANARWRSAGLRLCPWVNDHGATRLDLRAPFGGMGKSSGIGRELGREGMHDFTETHVMAVPSE